VRGRVIRYRPGTDPEPKDRTDWVRLRSLTDEEVEAAARSDPDARPMSEEQLARSFRPFDIIRTRKRLGLSQAAFARRFQLNLRTLQDWEQGRRAPEEIARAYLRVIERNPDAVAAALED
jgi:putative transcriptional regulator